MGLTIERVPTLGDNYSYLLICDETGEASVVDVPEAGPVLKRIEASGAKITKILSTHHHFDHSAANPDLAKRFDVPVYGHASDSGRLPGQTDGLEEGDTIRVGNQQASILFIPAHTKGTSPTTSPTPRPSFAATPCSWRAAAGSSKARRR